MINLRVRGEFDGDEAPFVVKLEKLVNAQGLKRKAYYPEEMAVREDGALQCELRGRSFTLFPAADQNLDGDIVLCHPRQGIAERLIRRGSRHNTILFTERCDQLCVMCSQPPKNKDYTWLFEYYSEAILLADQGVTVGISGGEPTLYLDSLLKILEEAADQRPDLDFHILSNAQHFRAEHLERLARLHKKVRIVWGVPLYSHSARTHDEIVGKKGAYDPLLKNLYLLAQSGANIELRTVLTAKNVGDLPALSNFIRKNLAFISHWAIMAMEPIGYAKANRDALYFDHSAFPEPLIAALSLAELSGVAGQLFNFPRCTIPESHRRFCTDSISDWKKKYLDVCDGCSERESCCGFFEWYSDDWSWSGVRPLQQPKVGGIDGGEI